MDYVRPREWMKEMPLTRFDPISKLTDEKQRKLELARRKTIRKNEIKAFMALKFPMIKVTLKNADALGILWWASLQQQELKL
jgi:hypothetical protein